MIKTGDLVKVKGTVTAFDKYYVMNAELTARKTRTKAYTDSFGRFEIVVPGGDVLIFKANGFEKNRREMSAEEDGITRRERCGSDQYEVIIQYESYLPSYRLSEPSSFGDLPTGILAR